MKDRSDDPSHDEFSIMTSIYINVFLYDLYDLVLLIRLEDNFTDDITTIRLVVLQQSFINKI